MRYEFLSMVSKERAYFDRCPAFMSLAFLIFREMQSFGIHLRPLCVHSYLHERKPKTMKILFQSFSWVHLLDNLKDELFKTIFCSLGCRNVSLILRISIFLSKRSQVAQPDGEMKMVEIEEHLGDRLITRSMCYGYILKSKFVQEYFAFHKCSCFLNLSAF